MLKSIKNHLPTIISVLAAAVLIALTLIWFGSRLSGRDEAEEEKYFADSTRVLASVFTTRLNDQIAMLETQARYFDNVDLSDYNAMKDTVMAMKGIGSFSTIGVANAAGATINHDGKSYGNLLLKDVFDKTMRGAITVSDKFLTDDEGYDVLMAGVPITQNGSTVGMIFGTFGRGVLASLLSDSSLPFKGTSVLLGSEGEVIVIAEESSSRFGRLNNLFEETGAVRPESGGCTVTECMVAGSGCVVTVADIGDHGWYYASILPVSGLSRRSGEDADDMKMMTVFISVAFFLLFVSILYLVKSNKDIQRANERFKLVTVEAQDLVFDYNFQKQQLELDGSVENIISDIRSEYTRAETLALLGLIHEEDKEFRSRLLELRTSEETSIKSEFRVKCLNGAYSWFRMRASVVRGHDGAPQRLIGSMINADEQMNREQRLVGRDETDPVTGIFSKNAFYDRVSEQLRSASDSDLFAIYIIDIDNFSDVNESLGHVMGDNVLADVAKKLCIVFSDMDCVGRIGGDEFAAFLRLPSKARNLGMNLIENKAKAICSQINETYSAKNKQVSITASVGVAIYPYSGRDYNTLFRHAGTALTESKKGGKNKFGIYSPEMNENWGR
ncbi:MAG: diguanylate cyclase [Ruminiclostridium sp.]|nr:diguanylate cyclase [Ruminiclostridium sp.]